MAPVRTKRIALVSTTIPPYKRRKDAGGGSGPRGSITIEPSAVVSEDAVEGEVIGTIVTVPFEAEIELIDDAGGRFVLDGYTLVTGPTGFDYETASQHTIVIRAVAGAFAFDQSIVVSVINVVELSDIFLSNASITENTVPGTLIGALTSSPSGATFGLLQNAGNRFAVQGTDLVAGAVATDHEASASHQIEVLAARGGETLAKTFTITVADVNELTSIALSNATTPENSVAPAIVGGLSSTPAGAAFTLVDNAGGRFALSGNNLVRGATGIDYETATSHDVTVRASRLGEVMEQTFTIAITNVNEIADITLSAASVEENTGAGVTVGVLASVPAGAALTLTNTASNRFALSGNTLVTGAVSTNYENARSHDVTVQADAGADTYTKTFTIAVTDVYEGFSISLSNATLAENTAPGAIIGGFTSDPDGATYALLDNAGNRFSITGDNLVTGAVATNYEAAASHAIEVRGTRDGTDVDQMFTITVTDVDEISDITLSNATIAENAAANVAVGALSSTPAGATWSLTDTAGSRFAVSGNNLVRGATALDYETATSHSVTVRGTIGGETFDKTFTITVQNVVEISDITLSPSSTPEDSTAGASVGTLASVPPGATFTLVDNAGSRFALSGSTITRGSTALDYETATSHAITVRGDRGGESMEKTLTIQVSNVNEISAITLSGATISEDAAQNTSVGTLSSTPGGATFTLTDTAGGRFALSGATVVRGATALDYETATSHQITVQAQVGVDVATQTFTITVTNVAELSSFTLSNTSVAENIGQGSAIGTLSSSPAGATFSVVNSSSNRVAVSGTSLVRGSTALDYETAPSFGIRIRAERGGEALEQDYTISVSNVDELTGISLSANSISEDAGQGAGVGVLSSTPPGASFSLTDTAGNRFALSGNTVVRGSTALDYETATSHQITVYATLGADTETQSFTINVIDVNESLEFDLNNKSMPDNAPQGTQVGALTSSTPGASYQMLDDSAGRFALSGANVVAGSRPADINVSPSYNITVRGTKDAIVTDEVFPISLTSVYPEIYHQPSNPRQNQAPGASCGFLYYVPHSSAEASGSATWALLDDAGGRFALGNGTGPGLVQGATPLGAEGTTHNITVRATVPGGAQRTQVIPITVISDVSPGVFRAGGGGFFYMQGTAGGGTSQQISATNAGPVGAVSYAWAVDPRLPLNISSTTAASPTFSIPAGTPAGFYKGMILCTMTDTGSGVVRYHRAIGGVNVTG